MIHWHYRFDQILRHIGVVGQQLLSIFGQAIATARCQVLDNIFHKLFFKIPPIFRTESLIFLDNSCFSPVSPPQNPFLRHNPCRFRRRLCLFLFSIFKTTALYLSYSPLASFHKPALIFFKNSAYRPFLNQKQIFSPTPL